MHPSTAEQVARAHGRHLSAEAARYRLVATVRQQVRHRRRSGESLRVEGVGLAHEVDAEAVARLFGDLTEAAGWLNTDRDHEGVVDPLHQ